jgi:hypothetical protein
MTLAGRRLSSWCGLERWRIACLRTRQIPYRFRSPSYGRLKCSSDYGGPLVGLCVLTRDDVIVYRY